VGPTPLDALKQLMQLGFKDGAATELILQMMVPTFISCSPRPLPREKNDVFEEYVLWSAV
jgi:hypothetical protein